jgi:hypothetical protein
VPASDYWDHRYRSGGTSGLGSVGEEREWKWSVIDSYVQDLDDVVDIGCGDLSFWENRREHLPDDFRYFGLDVSGAVVDRNRRRYPDWRFHVGDASDPIPGIEGRIVLCLDVLFHILDNEVYDRIVENLTRYSSEWISLSTWWRNPFDFRWRLRHLAHTKRVALAENEDLNLSTRVGRLVASLTPRQLGRDLRFLAKSTESNGLHVKYRRFDDRIHILETKGFTKVAEHRDPRHTAKTMYVFHRNAPITP